MTKYAIPCVVAYVAACTVFAAGIEVRKIEVWDQVVAKVNTEAISKRDVEDKMGEIAFRLLMFKKERTANGQWNADAEAQWTQLYVEAFRDALRKIVRERLMLQHFVMEKMTLDEKNVQKQLTKTLNYLREHGVKGVDANVESKRVKESMMLESFRGKFDNELEFPKKPEVAKYYRDHIDRYQRKAAVKVRLIHVDISYTDKLTLQRKVREDVRGIVQEIRRDIVDLGNSFAEVAKIKNDNPELCERGGLVLGTNNDPYLIIDEFNKTLANAIRNVEVGKVSEIFEYGKGYAIALVEERREAGSAPLEGKLYDQIYNEMYEAKKTKKEDEWFRATLAKTLVMQIVEGQSRMLPIDFFFPDDKKDADFVSDKSKPDGKADGKSDEKKNEKKNEKK